jgi:hypothetical protein
MRRRNVNLIKCEFCNGEGCEECTCRECGDFLEVGQGEGTCQDCLDKLEKEYLENSE